MASDLSGRSVVTSLGPREFVGGLRLCATVLRDHAAALDGLDVADGSFDAVDQVPSDDRGESELDDDAARTGPDPVSGEPGPGPGSDLAVTLGGACDAVEDDSDFSVVCRALSAGAHAAARNESGRRLAAFLAGAADALRNADRVDGSRFALALEAGAERVTEADDGAHPGCLLAVMSAAADGALDAADATGDLVEVLVSAAEAGLVELEQGPLVDARLAQLGTVDAAAAGFLLVLDSLAAVVGGDPLPEPPRPAPSGRPVGAGERFLVRCVMTPPAPDIEAAAELEVVLHELADRLSFDPSGHRWTVESVTAFPGATVEALAGAGTLAEVHIGLAGARSAAP